MIAKYEKGFCKAHIEAAGEGLSTVWSLIEDSFEGVPLPSPPITSQYHDIPHRLKVKERFIFET